MPFYSAKSFSLYQGRKDNFSSYSKQGMLHQILVLTKLLRNFILAFQLANRKFLTS